MTKVLFIMHMPPPVHGAAMMGQYIHDSELINQQFDCHYVNLALAKNLTDIGKGGLGKLKDFIDKLRAIRQQVKTIKPDLCYVTPNAQGKAFYKDYITVQLLKKMGCKVVIHYHNKGVSSKQNKLIDNLLYKSFFKQLKVILLAETLYHDIQKYVAKKDVFICPNGIPPINDTKQDKETHSKPVEILFLSNLIESKGPFDLLKACKILKQKGLSFHCSFIGSEGDISKEQFLKKINELELNSHVAYLGKRFGAEKQTTLAQADIFAFPSYYHYECFPLVLLEAMQYKLPIVSTYEGAIPQMVENNKNGFLVKQRNIEELADKLELLLIQPEMRLNMGLAGFRKYTEEYTINRFEQNINRIFTEVLAK